MLERAVRSVRAALPAAPTVLVVRQDKVESAVQHWGPEGIAVVPGGELRQDSVRRGVEALDLDDEDLVAIHDGARPFVPAEDTLAVVRAAEECGAAVLVAPVVDTLKRVGPTGAVVETVSRENLARALTPQAFRVAALRRAWAAAGAGPWTDEAALVESQGGEVRAVTGDPRNVKITRREDVRLVEGVLSASFRVGQGIDVHPFAPGRPMWLCGVEIECELGLAGHSDADAALHAVTDAILGACGEGDIGDHFPPSEEHWRGVASAVFVRDAVERAAFRGWCVANCDLTILAERPRISPHRGRMRERLAELLGVGVECVSVKATTTEGLGFVGRREGVLASAVVLLERR